MDSGSHHCTLKSAPVDCWEYVSPSLAPPSTGIAAHPCWTAFGVSSGPAYMIVFMIQCTTEVLIASAVPFPSPQYQFTTLVVDDEPVTNAGVGGSTEIPKACFHCSWSYERERIGWF